MCFTNFVFKSIEFSLLFGFSCFALYIILKLIVKLLRHFSHSRTKKIIGIFHPYCNAGGGGERVLWCLVKFIQEKYPEQEVVIYTGDQDATSKEILDKMQNNFKIELKSEPRFVFLRSRKFVEAQYYPFFTLLGQSLGSVILGLEALFKCVPDLYIDTMGYGFTYPIFKFLADCQIAAYTHYPIISTDMIDTVNSNAATFNNRRFISNSKILTKAKLLYYQMFAWLYGVVGRQSDLVMVNSSWTKGHIVKLWGIIDRVHLVYPPCNTQNFEELTLDKPDDSKYKIVSVAQFRPEKNHALQIEALHLLIRKLDKSQHHKVKLVLVGSCRNKDDEKRVEALRQLAFDLAIQDNVDFSVNFSFGKLLEICENSGIGLHSMYNEHFGISVVENISAGLVTIANNSGGPKLDIISDGRNGFLAATAEEYAELLYKIIKMDNETLSSIRTNGRKDMKRFSDEQFQVTLSSAFSNIVI